MDVRPPPRLWLRFAFGGRLPDSHLGWVHTTLTRPGWSVRQIGRVAVQLAPFQLVLTVVTLTVPDLKPFERALIIVFLPISSLMTVAMVSTQLRDRRLRQHELPVPDDDPWKGPTYRY